MRGFRLRACDFVDIDALTVAGGCRADCTTSPKVSKSVLSEADSRQRRCCPCQRCQFTQGPLAALRLVSILSGILVSRILRPSITIFGSPNLIAGITEDNHRLTQRIAEKLAFSRILCVENRDATTLEGNDQITYR